MRKRKTIPLVLFILLVTVCSFLFASYSHAITITGSETVTTNSNTTYTAAGCSGSVAWGVTGTGASIRSNGVLTTGTTSCGAITVTASCSDGSIATKTVRVTNAGGWLEISLYACTPIGGEGVYPCYYPLDGQPTIEIKGKYKAVRWSLPCYWSLFWKTNLGPVGLSADCFVVEQLYGMSTVLPYLHTDWIIPGSVGISRVAIYEWQCPPCTNGQTISCYTGTGGTAGVGICKAGTQTCTNGQWGGCQGEVLPATEICGDGKDNNCDGQVDEGCEKILKYVSGSGQEDFICKTLQNPFVVSVSGATQGDVGINWQITESPSGSNASIVGEATTFADSEIISSAYLKLGSLPGSYTAEARCSECTQGSPQIFSATAKCPEVPLYYQDDYSDTYDNLCAVGINPKTKKKYGVKSCEKDAQGNVLSTEIPYTIAGKGCAMTSIAMVLGRYGSQASPAVWNKFLTQINGYAPKGNVRWDVPDILGMIKYVDKSDHYGDKKSGVTVSQSLMNHYLKKCMPIIVQVFNQKTGNMHWVVVTGKNGDDYTINDPSRGNDYEFLSQYGDIYNIRSYEKTGGCQ